jgi:hypothetical protein
MTSLIGGFPWNEYNWHRRNNQYLLDRQFGYFRHDGNRPVQPTPVYPYVDGVDLPYGNKPAGVDGLDGGLMSRRAEANVSCPRAELPRGDLPETEKAQILNLSPSDQGLA